MKLSKLFSAFIHLKQVEVAIRPSFDCINVKTEKLVIAPGAKKTILFRLLNPHISLSLRGAKRRGNLDAATKRRDCFTPFARTPNW